MAEKNKLSRHEGREIIFKMLFAKDFDKEADAAAFYQSYMEHTEEPESEYVRNTFLGVCGKTAEIDEEVESVSVKWKMARMSVATRSVLRLAVYEMTDGEIPAKVAINEAVEITKAYDDEAAAPFVNGILNKIARTHGCLGDAE